MTTAAPPAPSRPSSETGPAFDVGVYAEKYVKLRDKKAEIAERHKTELQPYNEAMQTLEGLFMQHLLTTGAESIKTAGGTIHITTKWSATINDAHVFRQWLDTTGNWELVDIKANAPKVRDFNKDVPGVTLSSFQSIGVRRAKPVAGSGE